MGVACAGSKTSYMFSYVSCVCVYVGFVWVGGWVHGGMSTCVSYKYVNANNQNHFFLPLKLITHTHIHVHVYTNM